MSPCFLFVAPFRPRHWFKPLMSTNNVLPRWLDYTGNSITNLYLRYWVYYRGWDELGSYMQTKYTKGMREILTIIGV